MTATAPPETITTYPVTIFLLFFMIGLFFLIIMTLLTMRLFDRTKGHPGWLKPVMITLLVLFFLSGLFNVVFFIPWLILLLLYWRK